MLIPRVAPRAFTLVELLVVMAIAAILAAISVPAISSVLSAYSLSSASQSLLGQLMLARENALANNRSVQVRFYRIADDKGVPVYRGMQAFQENTDNNGDTTLTPITKVYLLPMDMWIVYNTTITTASTLFTTATSGAETATGDAAHPLPPPYGSSPYLYFRFRPTGSTDLSASSLITLASEKAPIVADNLPANFITLRIDAINGIVRTYQP